MTEKPEILFLAHRIPYPPDKGDKIRSWRLFDLMTTRFRVHLGCFIDDPADWPHRDFLAARAETAAFIGLNPRAARAKSLAGFLTGAPLSAVYFAHSSMRRYVARMRARPLAAEVAFSSVMAPYIAAPVAGRPRFVDFCDADSEKWRQYAETARGPKKLVFRREAEKLAALETGVANWADRAFAVSESEAALFNARPGVRRRVDWFGNGADTDYFCPDPNRAAPAPSADVVFVGAMDYAANVEAALWFARRVWPQVRATHADARFALVGPRPGAALKALDGRDGIVVTGRVGDVRPWLQQARAVVAPLRVARGVQNKVLEAMATGRPVVATAAANTGIDAAPGAEILLADEPAAFAAAVAGLLDDPARGDRLGAAARARIVRDFSWRSQLEPFAQALSRLPAR